MAGMWTHELCLKSLIHLTTAPSQVPNDDSHCWSGRCSGTPAWSRWRCRPRWWSQRRRPCSRCRWTCFVRTWSRTSDVRGSTMTSSAEATTSLSSSTSTSTSTRTSCWSSFWFQRRSRPKDSGNFAATDGKLGIKNSCCRFLYLLSLFLSFSLSHTLSLLICLSLSLNMSLSLLICLSLS